MGKFGTNPRPVRWLPTIRWTGMDELAHYVAYAHFRLCDHKFVKGLNHEVGYVTCLRCLTLHLPRTRAEARRQVEDVRGY